MTLDAPAASRCGGLRLLEQCLEHLVQRHRSGYHSPVITSVTPSTGTLWSPNHKMVPITVTVVASDLVCVTSLKIISVTSNEPDNGLGDGDTANDIEISGDLTVNLRGRAFRQGQRSHLHHHGGGQGCRGQLVHEHVHGLRAEEQGEVTAYTRLLLFSRACRVIGRLFFWQICTCQVLLSGFSPTLLIKL